MIGEVSARCLPHTSANASPARFPDTVSSKTSRRSPLVSHDDWGRLGMSGLHRSRK